MKLAIDLSPGLGYLPVIWMLFTLVSFLICYSVSVAEGHIYPILPSISDTGAQVPELNVFSFCMNISVILGIGNYFTRYFQCQYQARQCGENREIIFKANKISLLLSLLSLVGGLVVANVQSRKVGTLWMLIRTRLFYLSQIPLYMPSLPK